MLLGVLVAPVLEETIFRGYIYPVAARSFGVTGGVLFTGTIFGLLHASQLWGGWGQIALLVVVGIVFTYARAATHTVVASYLMHVSYNSFLFLAWPSARTVSAIFPALPDRCGSRSSPGRPHECRVFGSSRSPLITSHCIFQLE